MRKLEGDRSLRLENQWNAGDEVIDVGHMRQHVVAGDQIGKPAFPGDAPRQRFAEELDDALDAVNATGVLGHVARGLDAQNRHACPLEVLQQVAVVARKLDDQRLRRKVETGRHGRGIGLGVLEPGFRIAREVGVVLVEMRRRLDMRELNQPAGLADHRDQRVEALPALRHVFGGAKMIGNGRQPEVGDDLLERLAAESALMLHACAPPR